MKEKLFDFVWPKKIFGSQLESISPFQVFYTILTDFDQKTTADWCQLNTLYDLKLFDGRLIHLIGVLTNPSRKGAKQYEQRSYHGRRHFTK